MVASVTGLLSSYNINIGKMKVYRKRRGGEAIMVIEVDQEIDQAVADKLIKLPCVNEVTVLNPL